jgi:hypothetical protein
MMFPLIVAAMGGYMFVAIRHMQQQEEIQRGITERAGFYPNGCEGPCEHFYCQMLRNAK